MIISLIAALGRNRQLGKDNQMLWHIKEDFKHFKETTMGHTLLMGRKTFESIGRPLPGRETFILTRDKDYHQEKCHTVHSLEEAYSKAKEMGESELFVAGGGEVYRQTLAVADKLILSFVDFDGEADAFFPEVDFTQWKKIDSKTFAATEKTLAWELATYQKDPS